MVVRKHCDLCKEEVSRLALLRKIIKDDKKLFLCKSCYSKNRKERRDETKRSFEGLTFPKLIIPKKEERKEKKKIPFRYMTDTQRQRIKDFKSKRKINLSLTMDEKKLLWNKAYEETNDYDKSSERLTNTINHLNNLVKDLEKQNKSTEDMNRIFKEEFMKMVNN